MGAQVYRDGENQEMPRWAIYSQRNPGQVSQLHQPSLKFAGYA